MWPDPMARCGLVRPRPGDRAPRPRSAPRGSKSGTGCPRGRAEGRGRATTTLTGPLRGKAACRGRRLPGGTQDREKHAWSPTRDQDLALSPAAGRSGVAEPQPGKQPSPRPGPGPPAPRRPRTAADTQPAPRRPPPVLLLLSPGPPRRSHVLRARSRPGPRSWAPTAVHQADPEAPQRAATLSAALSCSECPVPRPRAVWPRERPPGPEAAGRERRGASRRFLRPLLRLRELDTRRRLSPPTWESDSNCKSCPLKPHSQTIRFLLFWGFGGAGVGAFPSSLYSFRDALGLGCSLNNCSYIPQCGDLYWPFQLIKEWFSNALLFFASNPQILP